ncbi:PKD domain-containing protein [Paraflavisolibacter sp. H34]|uniref:PKD domain-containing protein n=1 Tax=Huijunlia imazamoxiresistens TaxID=3127457 RepID=UPI00301A00B2
MKKFLAMLLACFSSVLIFAQPSGTGSLTFLSTALKNQASAAFFADINNAGSDLLHHFPNRAGGSFFADDSILVSGSPTICQGEEVEITAQKIPDGASLQWKKDDEAIQGATADKYTARSSGTYTLVVTAGGKETIYPKTVVKVNSVPEAGFTFSPNARCSNVPVQFTSTSSGTGLTYAWNFGDTKSGGNNSSIQRNPAHTFIGTTGTDNQNFTVSLTVTNNLGCSDRASAPVTTKRVSSTSLGGDGETTYEGKPFFKQCGSVPFEFTFFNKSTTVPDNKSYRIIWGDDSPDFISPVFSSDLLHTYPVGTHNLQFIVENTNGCLDTAAYSVFVGSNPAVGLGNPGNTSICTGSSLTFPVTGTANNPPGTTYKISFNDGTLDSIFQHPVPHPQSLSVRHTFDRTSCNISSSDGSNTFLSSFAAGIVASNPCGTSAGRVVPIYVSQKPEPAITLSHDVVCVNSLVTMSNSGQSGNTVDFGGCTSGVSVWSVSPASGWSVISGNTGNDHGRPSPSSWTPGTGSVQLRFSTPGVYSITLKAGGNALCGIGTVIKTICVNPEPTASFTVDKSDGCAPLHVQATSSSNTPSCGTNTYEWSVTYSNASGCTPGTSSFSYASGSSTSANPGFQFINPGEYTISLVTKNSSGACISTAFSRKITVKAKPAVSFSSPGTICQNASIRPQASVSNCYSTTAATYTWSFPGGSPASATTADPGNITYATAGTHDITLAVTNECGTTTITRQIRVQQAPAVTVPSNQAFCHGTSMGGFSFSGSMPGTSFNWTNSHPSIGLGAGGSGSIPGFVATNNGSVPVVATITITPTLNGCSGPSASFTITVHPKPAMPVAGSNSPLCSGNTLNLTATSATPGASYSWTGPGNFTSTEQNPTINNATTAASGMYSVTATLGSCTSVAGTTQVTVTSKPVISGASSQAPSACNTATGSITLNGLTAGKVYTVNYKRNGSAESALITADGSGNLRLPNLRAGSYTDISVTLNGCSSNELTGYTLSDPNPPATPVVTANSPLCAGATLNFTAASTTPGATYAWAGPDNFLRSEQNPSLVNATVAVSGTYTVTASVNGCTSTASIPVTVKPATPPAQAGADRSLCAVSEYTLEGQLPAGTTGSWSQVGPATGNLVDATSPISKITGLQPGTDYRLQWTLTGSAGCPSTTATVVLRNRLPLTAAQAGPDQVACDFQSTRTLTLTGNAATGRPYEKGEWRIEKQPAGSSATFSDKANPASSFTFDKAGIYELVWTITNDAGDCAASSDKMILRAYDKPVSGTLSGATDVCQGNNVTLTLSGAMGDIYKWEFNPAPLAGGAWTGTSYAGPSATFTNVQETFSARAIVRSQGQADGCPAEVVSNVLLVNVAPPSDPGTTSGATTVCKTANSGTVTLSGYTGSILRWESSENGGASWTPVAHTAATLPYAGLLQTTWFRAIVRSGTCGEAASSPTVITVEPPVTNNTLTSVPAVCVNTAPAVISGSSPQGADGNYAYQWQSSTDGRTWNNIPGAAGKDYAPPVLTATTWYRRAVQTSLCTGPQSNVSNAVEITVHPDAWAGFSFAPETGCAPFVLDGSVIRLQPSADPNTRYEWFADGNPIGSGTAFPGHTLIAPGASVLIGLKATSAFGCKDDQFEHRFFTYAQQQPAFTLDQDAGCGPLTVVLSNTTPQRDQFTYRWDFGNGQTSTEARPGSQVFLPNPTYGDTTYTIRLTAISPCEEVSVTKTVLVKSKPRALFAPSKTVGCSPMEVSFNNASLGVGVRYEWSFEEGATLATDRDTLVRHTYTTGVPATYQARLTAINACGNNSLTYNIVVAPNSIKLDFAVNGDEKNGCAPHTARFINNSKGASGFRWDFKDGNFQSTTQNIETVPHIFEKEGVYDVVLHASNGCTDTSAVETIRVFPKPKAAFSLSDNTLCLGEPLRLTNSSDAATSYLWQFSDGSTSTLVEPEHRFSQAGPQSVKLVTTRINPPGNVCRDEVTQPVLVVANKTGSFDASDLLGSCPPFAVTFTNRNTPAVTATWDFGDGATQTGDQAAHTFVRAGTFNVKLTARAPGGCTYTTERTVQVLGPAGTLRYTGGVVCNDAATRFEVTATHTDSLRWDFGDGISLVTKDRVVHHSYAHAGSYLPSVTLLSRSGCSFPINGTEALRVDQLKAGFTLTTEKVCGKTSLQLTDTAKVYSGTASIAWALGDGTTATGATVRRDYTVGGNYTLRQTVTGNSGCAATLELPVAVAVNAIPKVTVNAPATGCSDRAISFKATVQSADALNPLQWTVSNGTSGRGEVFPASFAQTGTYDLTVVAGTVNGCFDQATHRIRIDPSPVISASEDLTLCKGASAPLAVSGTQSYSWTPVEGLSCTTCANPVAQPATTTPYVVRGTNSFGCTAFDTVVVRVMTPLKLAVSKTDSICIGQSSRLLASGASTYVWTPAAGLSAADAPNPIARPALTTRYRVVGYDGYNCFTDTAFVLVAVGEYPTVSLGPDLTLATGTQYSLKSTVQNGPIKKWEWSPATDLSCSNCALPVARVKKSTDYTVTVTNNYNCSASDTISIKAFCESAQVFIPNAFTPDGDGINDLLMVRAGGIAQVKTFRIFNRWGELVFERSGFVPNDKRFGWDGRIHGKTATADVYVYTCEVVCENGVPYTYKGNVSLIK